MAGQGARARVMAAAEWIRLRWGAFRAESPYFQAKVGIVAAYVVVVMLTVIIAPPRGPKWLAVQERIPFGLAFKTALKITNARNGDLDDVTLDIDGKGIEFDGKQVPGHWTSKPLSLPEGLETKVFAEQLFDAQGVNPPYSLVIDTARVLDKKQRLVVELHPPKVGKQ